MDKEVYKISWDEILVDNLLLPEELICYYLHKYHSDLSKKKNNKAEQDLSYVKNYLEKNGGMGHE